MGRILPLRCSVVHAEVNLIQTIKVYGEGFRSQQNQTEGIILLHTTEAGRLTWPSRPMLIRESWSYWVHLHILRLNTHRLAHSDTLQTPQGTMCKGWRRCCDEISREWLADVVNVDVLEHWRFWFMAYLLNFRGLVKPVDSMVVVHKYTSARSSWLHNFTTRSKPTNTIHYHIPQFSYPVISKRQNEIPLPPWSRNQQSGM